MSPWARAPRITWRSTGRSECQVRASVGAPAPGGSSSSAELAAAPRYCGKRPQFVASSRSNKITVHFHSDQSYTDTGFLAEFLSFDARDREYCAQEAGPGWRGDLRLAVHSASH